MSEPRQSAATFVQLASDAPLSSGRGPERFIVVTGVAALLVLAALALAGYNFATMHSSMQLTLVFAIVSGAHTAGLRLLDSTRFPRASVEFFIAGCLAFCA